MISCIAVDGDSESYTPAAPTVVKPWRVYCGATKQSDSLRDPDGKWDRLYRRQEFWHEQTKHFDDKATERRKRAIVQVRREGLLKTRRDAHAMFAAHCAATLPPPPPKLSSLDELVPKKKTIVLRRINSHEEGEAVDRSFRVSSSTSQMEHDEGDADNDVFPTRLTSTALSAHSSQPGQLQPGVGGRRKDGNRKASSSSGSNDSPPPWPTPRSKRTQLDASSKNVGKNLNKIVVLSAAQRGLNRVNAVPADKLRSAEDLWAIDDEFVIQDDNGDDGSSEDQTPTAFGFVGSAKSAVGPSFPLKQNSFLSAPSHIGVKPNSIREHLWKAGRMTEKRHTATSDRPLTSTGRGFARGNQQTLCAVGPPPVISFPIPPTKTGNAHLQARRRPDSARSIRSQFSIQSSR